MSFVAMETTQPLRFQQGESQSYSPPTDEWIRLVVMEALRSPYDQFDRKRLRRQQARLRRRSRANLASRHRLPLASVPYNSVASRDNVLETLSAPRTITTQWNQQLCPEVPTSTAASTNYEPNGTVSRQSDIKIPCPVCLDMCQNITSTFCGHVFCAECIETAVRNTQKCPLCNQRLSLNALHPLYV